MNAYLQGVGLQYPLQQQFLQPLLALLHLDLCRVFTVEEARERMVGAIPTGGGAHELATVRVRKRNIRQRSVGIPFCQSYPGACGGMSYVPVSYTGNAAVVVDYDVLQQCCVRQNAKI